MESGSGEADRERAGPDPGPLAAAANPCLTCGACCAAFRVDFDIDELESNGGRVPDSLAEAIGGRIARMRGTDYGIPRCAALTGRLGQRTSCAIHPWRPSPCREFGLRAPFGIGDPGCARARSRHGLEPLPGS